MALTTLWRPNQDGARRPSVASSCAFYESRTRGSCQETLASTAL
jgi:hypothetical protein